MSPVFLALTGDSLPEHHLGSHITNTKANLTYKQNKIGKIKTQINQIKEKQIENSTKLKRKYKISDS